MKKPKKDVRNQLVLIRVTKEERKIANELSKDYKCRISQMFRQFVIDAKSKKYVNMPMKIAEKEKEVLRELKKLLEAVKNIV